MGIKVVKKKKSDALSIQKNNLGELAKEYDELSSQIKVLDSRKKELSKLLKEGAVKYGTEDDKGSSYLKAGGFYIGNVSRVSMSIDQEKAVAFLEENRCGDLIDVVTVKTVNEDKLAKAVSDQRLTLAEVNGFTNKKETFQVSVKRIEDMPEVEQSDLSVAAKKRK